MQLAEFVRAFQLRGPDLMWLLGAGASAAAGVPTAGQLIWKFRQLIYCSEQQVPRSLVENFADPAVAGLLLSYFRAQSPLPSPDDSDEYSALFEMAYPSEADRRRFIDEAFQHANPSFGHVALGSLMALDRVRLVWTTNFDALIEDAATQALGRSSRLAVAQIETAQIAIQALNQNRWPLVAKLHGDFRSARLKNTKSELQEQDETMREALLKASDRFGLIVVGYSGRDQSVMETLQRAADTGAFPNGLFWVHRGTGEPSNSVLTLIKSVRAKGNQAELLRVETFDELMDALLNVQDIPEEHSARLDEVRTARRRTPAPLHGRNGGWPLVRLNALPVTEYPTSCRRIVCRIGGTKEVRGALEENGSEGIAVRRRDGVIAFGADADLKQAFGSFGIETFDLATITVARNPNSMDLSLLYEALLTGLSRNRPVKVMSWPRRMIAADTRNARAGQLRRLTEAVGQVTGVVPGTRLEWAEAVQIRLESRLDQLWLVYEPRIWVERGGDEATRMSAREWSRERGARRYNSAWNELLHGWEEVLGSPDEEPTRVSAFGSIDGINATFALGSTAAYSMGRR